MKNLIFLGGLMLVCSGCASWGKLPEVSFEWFNLSTNEIWVTDVVGLPIEASPGRLTQNRSEDQLERSESTFSEIVRIKDRITIKWMENEQHGWPGALKPGELVPPGVAHEAEFKRDELGIPARLSSGKIRFTYLGNDKWRVKFFSE